MFACLCGLLMAGFPVAFTLAGVAILFGVLGIILGVFPAAFLFALPQRIFGLVTNEVLVAVPLFVFMGVMLERSRVAEDLLDCMARLFGPLRGGLGISVSVVGALLAASTGIVGATVVTMGLISLPSMLKRGYDPALACGAIAAAGTLGQIIPPSIVLVLLGDVLQNAYQLAQLEQGIFAPETVTVGDLFAGALLPGLLLVALYIAFQAARAFLDPASSPAMPAGEARPDLARVLAALVPPVVLIVAVLGSILAGVATPTESAAVGAVGALALAGARLRPALARRMLLGGLALAVMLALARGVDLRLGREDLGPGDAAAIAAAVLLLAVLAWALAGALAASLADGTLAAVCRQTLEITAMVFAIAIGAALFSLVFRGLGGDETVRRLLADLPGGAFGAMLAVMAVMFVMGFFLDFLEIVFVVVPLVAPALLKMGIDPVWLGVMMAVNLQTSFLTPPFGFALFYLRGVAPAAVPTGAIYRGVVPFVLLQLLCLAILALFPALATWLPAVLFK
ncbi:MAG: hypothetical protein OHK0024_01340 [Thalassobaculales bacterium]